MSSKAQTSLADLPYRELWHALQHARNTVLAHRYGVHQRTVWRWRKIIGLPPFPRGRPKKGPTQQALLATLRATGTWMDARQLRAGRPGGRQNFYELMRKLCAAGQVERRGTARNYAWAAALHTTREEP